jgi:hypothetical protein
MSEYLKRAAKLRGEFAWTKSGKLCFEQWYTEFRGRDVQDDTGTVERLHDHVLKVAMLLQISVDMDNLVLGDDVVNEAVQIVETLGVNAKKNFLVDGKSASKEHIGIVLKQLFKSKDFQITRPVILQRCWGHMNVQELDVAVITLQQMSYVTELSIKNVTHYRLTEKAIKHYLSEVSYPDDSVN